MRKRSKISLSNYHLTTAEMGTLFPVNVIDVLPGDSIQQVSNVFMRMSPMLAPVMHPIQIRLHHWFVPYRLIWDEFEDFITGGPRGVSTPDFPTIHLNNVVKATKNSLADYFRLPVSFDGKGVGHLVSALPFRAYALIWNNFYRDQDLQEELPISYESGADGTDYSLQRVSWKKDYFTTARPWTQKGVEVSVPISPGSNQQFYYSGQLSARIIEHIPQGINAEQAKKMLVSVTASAVADLIVSGSIGMTKTIEVADPKGKVLVTLVSADSVNGTNATAEVSAPNYSGQSAVPTGASYTYKSGQLTGQGSVDIRDLRLASALQRFEEARAKYGSRYNEFLMYLGVTPQDARLQLPEYLGGGKQIMQISEVLQTAEGQDSGVGTMRGHGLSAGKTRRYRRFIPEHGVIMTLMSVLPDPIYMQGIERMWLKRVKEDFFHHELASIGMQEVYQEELFSSYHTTGSPLPDFDKKTVFGYQDRYDEYRHAYSGVSGDFRDTLDYWHMARKFDTAPVLNGSFITANPTKRIFAEQTTNPLWIMVQNSVQARRMIPKRSKTKLQ